MPAIGSATGRSMYTSMLNLTTRSRRGGGGRREACRWLRLTTAPHVPLTTTTTKRTKSKTSTTNRGRRSLVSSSVSESEVGKFSDFANAWWDPRQNPLIGMNAIRVKYMVEQIRTMQQQQQQNRQSSTDPSTQIDPRPFSGLKALDVGCGGGILAESLARLGAHVTAIDPSEALVEQARQHAALDPSLFNKINYMGGQTVEELAASSSSSLSSSNDPQKYDIVCLLEVLEHVTDLESILLASQRLLKPDTGRLFVSTLNRTAKSYMIAILGAEYIMRYLPPGTHSWNQFLSPEEVQDLMDRVDLEPVPGSFRGMVVTRPPPPLGAWQWKLDKNDLDVNWIGSYKVKD